MSAEGGKKAIIVGAARGIGMATAEILAREGCDLAITARSEDGVKDAVANLRKYGTKVIGSAVNVKKADDYKTWLAETIDALVGDLGDADVRVLRGEGVRSREGTATGESVVQRALARVGETDQAEAFHDGRKATGQVVPGDFADLSASPCPVWA